MKKLQNKAIARIIVSLLLLASFILPTGITTNVVQAAAKPSIAATLKIGTGSIVGDYDYYSKSAKYFLSVSNVVKTATYSFTSSNTKILTVKASGSTVYLTGVKAGTATITCNQKLKGKTTKVGTCKVTVVNSTVLQDFIPVLPLGSGYTEVIEFANRNNDATYAFVSDSSNFSMKETLSTFDGMYFIKDTYTAKAVGTYTVTVKETYNKITRVVGKIKFTVKKATVTPDETIDMGLETDAFELISNCRTDVTYLFETEDSDIVQISAGVNSTDLVGKKVGTTKINIYEDAKTPDNSKLLGTCTITVKEVVLESLDYDFEDTEAYVGDGPVSVEVYKEPSHAPGTITVTSSDPKVATVSSVDEDGTFEVTPVSEGTTTITITCGTITKTQTFTVYGDEDY
jgi:hypothetical protein